MAQSDYFSGHGGQHSPNPPGAAQMLGRANEQIAQGIMKLSDEIGGALKRRGLEAKKMKKQGDRDRTILEYLRAEKDMEDKPGTAILPGVGTKEEITNLSNAESGNLLAAVLTGQAYEGEEKKQDATEASTDLAISNRQRVETMTPLAADASRASTSRMHQIMKDANLDSQREDETTQAVRFGLMSKPPVASDEMEQDLMAIPGEGGGDMGPFGRRMLEDSERASMQLDGIANQFPNADMKTVIELMNEKKLMAEPAFTPRAIQVPLMDGSGESSTVIMTGPKQGQVIDTPKTIKGKLSEFQKIPGKYGAWGIPDPDKPGEWKNVTHERPENLLSNFDRDGNNILSQAEVNEYRAEWFKDNPGSSEYDWNQTGIHENMAVPDPRDAGDTDWGRGGGGPSSGGNEWEDYNRWRQSQGN